MALIEFMREWGLPGVIIGMLAYFILLKDRAFEKERKANQQLLTDADKRLAEEVTKRVKDAQDFTRLALKIQADVQKDVSAMSLSTDEVGKLVGAVERLLGALKDDNHGTSRLRRPTR